MQKTSQETYIAAGKRLQRAMNKRHMSAAKLSRLSGLSPHTISLFLRGQRDMTLDELQTLGAILRVKPSWIAWG